MSFFDKIWGTPSETAKLKQLKEEAEKRRASKSSQSLKPIQKPEDIIDRTVSILNSRIDNQDKK
jgi:hypothetical protein